MHREDIPIEDPCDEDWDGMKRIDAHRRWCGRCSKLVVDLSSMTERRAQMQLDRPQRPCVRYRHDAAGELAFGLVPRARLSRRRPELEAVIHLASVASLLAMVSACATPSAPSQTATPAATQQLAPGPSSTFVEAEPSSTDAMYRVEPDASTQPRRVKRGESESDEDMPCCAGAPP
jgi:hypothetical protein